MKKKAIYGCAVHNDEQIHAERCAGRLKAYKIRDSVFVLQKSVLFCLICPGIKYTRQIHI